MRKLLIYIICGFLILPLALQAGTKGTLKGKVFDSEGKPVIGATVKVVGTPQGAYVKDQNGKFTILNINPGVYSVKVTAMGYEPYEQTDVRISVDDETNISVVMVVKGVKMGEVVVTIDRNMNRVTDIGSQKKMTSSQITSVAREGATSTVALSPGVFGGDYGWIVRGSRQSETQIRIDGLDVGNQFTGGFGRTGMTYFPMVSAYATEEVQVLTGGFSAEYGEALGGVVNTIVSSGRDDRYTAFTRYMTNVEPLYGKRSNGIKLVKDGDKYSAVPYGNGPSLLSAGDQNFEAGGGGPLPGILTKSTFYISTNNRFQTQDGGWNLKDPTGLELATLPNNNVATKNITGRMRFGITNDISLIVGGSFGMTNIENNSYAWYFDNEPGWLYDMKTQLPIIDEATGKPKTNGIPEGRAKQSVFNSLSSNALVRINHTINSSLFYELTVSNTSNNDYQTRRKGLDNPGYFTGYQFMLPQDNYAVEGTSIVAGKDKVVDWYQIIKKGQPTDDGYLMLDMTQRNPLTGYIEGEADMTGTNNPWGRQGVTALHGSDGALLLRKSNYWQIDGSVTHSIEGEFTHMLKAGFEVRLFELHYHFNSTPWDGIPFYDVYTDEWGGNLYADTSSVYTQTSKPYNPIKGSMYLQDQIRYKGIIISPGIRLDMFNPNSNYRLESVKFIPINSDTGIQKATTKFYFSPRINVAYPVTDRSNISITYGLFYKMPELQYLYDGFNKASLRGNEILGDPNMKPQRENMYEVKYANQIVDDISFDVSAYYKDTYNVLGLVYVRTFPVPYFRYAVSEFGNSKGLEFTLFKRRSSLEDHIEINLNYNLSFASATAADVGTNYMVQVDPYTYKPAYPMTEAPTTNDRRHRVNCIINLVWGNDQGPSIAGIQPMENMQFGFTTFWQSGLPYTRTDIKGQALGDLNTERQPSFWRTDMRLTKAFLFKDWFGDGAGKTSIEFSVDVYNLFDRQAIQQVFSRTNDPLDDGYAFYRKAGDFGSTVWYKKGDFTNADTYSPQQYDQFGHRFYNINGDFDKNGLVTQDEKFTNYRNAVEFGLQGQGNYQTPRTVNFSVLFRF